MTTHDLKIWPEFFACNIAGAKRFELRKDDRNYQVGDVLHLREWHPEGHFYSGREAFVEVTYVLRHRPNDGCAATFGLAPGYAILSVAPVAHK